MVGAPPAELIAEALVADAHHRGGETLAGRALTTVLTAPLRSRKHRGPILYDDIVKPSLRTGRPEPLANTIYRLGRS